MIITFSCSNKVHVYESGCGYIPTPPYETHSTVQDAKDYLISIGIDNISEVTYPTINREQYLQETFSIKDNTTYTEKLNRNHDWHPDSNI